MSKKSRKAKKQWLKKCKLAKRESVQTKRTAKNQYKWEMQVGYATRMLNRDKYFKVKNNEKTMG